MKLFVAVQLVTGGERGGAVDAGERAAGMAGVHMLLECLKGRQSLAAEGALDEAVVLEVPGTGSVLGQRHCNKQTAI